MKLKVDEKSDALYFRIDDSEIIDSKEVSAGIILDYNSKDEVVGIEILNVSRRSQPVNFKSLQYETA